MLKQLKEIIFESGPRGKAVPSLDGLLEKADGRLQDLPHIIPPALESPPRTPFDTDLPKEAHSLANLTPSQRLKTLPKVVPLMAAMEGGGRMYDGRFQPTHSRATSDFIAELESRAHKMGVQDIAYVKVPRSAIFKDKGIPAPYAIVFTVSMAKEPFDTAPSFECQLEVMDNYKRMAIIAARLSRFLRKNGFAAYPGTALGGLTDYCQLAELAGLGAIGYHGLLISPHDGALLRLNVIYTNIENLPLNTENEHLWVRDFCAMCRKCVRQCPADAIYDQPRPRPAGAQTIDHATCRDYFTRHFGCGVCVAVCPFSDAGYDKIKAHFKGNPTAPQFRIPVEAMEFD